MKETPIGLVIVVILFASLLMVAGLYLLANFNRLFRAVIRSELLRKNVVVWLIALCLFLAICPTAPSFYTNITNGKGLHYFLLQVLVVTIEALFVSNITWIVIKQIRPRELTFRKRMSIILCTIIGCTILASIPINYFANHGTFKEVGYTILNSFYTGSVTGLVYITMSYVDLERKRKLNEKELEVTRLQALKTKAELDALHSKINPHFLYNALNSIADLAVTDGKKARRMTIALADLFRYSINYNDHNYSTITDEVEMSEVYLQIEKIRFEDTLNYSVQVSNETGHYLVPRFLLQPIVENAVKHGLKATGQMTEIVIEVTKDNDQLQVIVADNGPAFPEILNPGYGIKNLYDKMDLLFPGQYEIRFMNHPRKQVSIRIQKLMKNEPAI